MAEGVYKITEDFEKALSDYTGAPYVVTVDNQSNALFLSLYYENIKGKEIKEETYHMDIYPTLLSLFKLNNYPWRGFGCDLTQDSFPRKMSEREISGISETIIRSNFFAEEDQKSVVKK